LVAVVEVDKRLCEIVLIDLPNPHENQLVIWVTSKKDTEHL
jgi:hypothetical protein